MNPSENRAKQKVALITGCSSGIGMLTAIEMARAGFRVVATMRNLTKRERLDQLALEAGVLQDIDVRPLDVTKFEELSGIVAEIASAHGRIDVLVNNAGFALGGFAEDIAIEELRDQLETNFFGQVAMTKAVLPIMRRQKGGHIIMVSSIAGLVATPVVGSYAASKHALEGWSEALRVELRALGIKVVLIEPGAFETEIWVKNAKMGAQAKSEASPNRERSQRFAALVQQKLRKGDACHVARFITRVAQDANPKLRYIVGSDAKVRFMLKRVLPWKLYERLVTRFTQIDS